MAEVLVLQSTYPISKEKEKKVYESFLKQKESGVIILPPGWNALLVPDDIEIVNPKYGTNHHVKDSFDKYMNPHDEYMDLLQYREEHPENNAGKDLKALKYTLVSTVNRVGEKSEHSYYDTKTGEWVQMLTIPEILSVINTCFDDE